MVAVAIIIVLYLASRFFAAVSGYLFEQYALSQYINGQNTTWHLFTNNYTPTNQSVPGDFTELALSGYASQTVNGGSWTVTPAAGQTTATTANISWTWTGSTVLYGYYVLDGSGNFVGAENFSGGPLTFPTGANSLVISPSWLAI